MRGPFEPPGLRAWSPIRALRKWRARRRFARSWAPRYLGAYASYEACLASVPPSMKSGYGSAEPDLFYDAMTRLFPWDYPVLFWLARLTDGGARSLIDAGGHQGTKFRVFREYLRLPPDFTWTVWDFPEVVRAGAARARSEGLTGLDFTEDLATMGEVDVFLASGLLQFLDITVEDLLGGLTRLPKHLLLNKVATRDGTTVVTLENMGHTATPYQIRNLEGLLETLGGLGYEELDRWEIPELSHVIPLYEHLGPSRSLGMYLRRCGNP